MATDTEYFMIGDTVYSIVPERLSGQSLLQKIGSETILAVLDILTKTAKIVSVPIFVAKNERER